MEANGRVNILGPDIPALFAMSDKIPVNKCTSFRDAMNGNWYDTLLSKTFFSKENIVIIQNGIRAGVYKRSNGQYLVGPQDCDEIKIVMRGVFLQNSKNLLNNITEQIKELNDIVLEYCIKQVYGEAEGYMKYKRDVSTLAVPLANPILSKNNDKQLFLKNFF